ncbi:hypothetical protein H740_03462 [Campylobacter showae CC57C]|uniref:Uncharacterized protein n=1 Tax=Campylobacter showae CC57C TaxID=1073353 RepID=M3JEB7_9BACT|nr:hypothetical protein H740_03462 [Campylobacter showae CC57C]
MTYRFRLFSLCLKFTFIKFNFASVKFAAVCKPSRAKFINLILTKIKNFSNIFLYNYDTKNQNYHKGY